MTDHKYCVILAGGLGTRFWPISKEEKPKQFRRVWKYETSFLQETFARMVRTFSADHIFVATLARYEDLVKEQLPDLPEGNIILEPYGRNTAPSIAYSATLLKSRDPEAVMVVVPADHDICNYALFGQTIESAISYVSDHDVLLTLGIVPTRPDTNFGYIQATGGRQAFDSNTPVKVKTFTEKPDEELAKVFYDSGEFLWNSGIFIWKASVLMKEMALCCPEIATLWTGWDEAEDKDAFVRKAYSDCPRTSIDYALMEKSDNVWLQPAKFGWSDLGSWSTLYEFASGETGDGNAVWCRGKQIIKETGNSLIIGTESGKLTVVQGLEDYMVIDTDDVLLVCPRGDRTFQEILSEIALPQYGDYR